MTKPTLTGYLLVLKASLKNQALIDMAVSSKALNRNLFHFLASADRLYSLTNYFNLYLEACSIVSSQFLSDLCLFRSILLWGWRNGLVVKST